MGFIVIVMADHSDIIAELCNQGAEQRGFPAAGPAAIPITKHSPMPDPPILFLSDHTVNELLPFRRRFSPLIGALHHLLCVGSAASLPVYSVAISSPFSTRSPVFL